MGPRALNEAFSHFNGDEVEVTREENFQQNWEIFAPIMLRKYDIGEKEATKKYTEAGIVIVLVI